MHAHRQCPVASSFLTALIGGGLFHVPSYVGDPCFSVICTGRASPQSMHIHVHTRVTWDVASRSVDLVPHQDPALHD